MISFKKYFSKCVGNKKSVRGFTLVELLVSLALFTSVITVAVGALFSAQAINARLEQKQIVLDGVNLSLETIARDIRYGSVFYCDNTTPVVLSLNRQDCPSNPNGNGGGKVIIFKPVIKLNNSDNYSLDRVAYYLDNGVIYKDEYPHSVTPNKGIRMTTPDVKIDTLNFFVTGAESFQTAKSDSNQPLITILISGQTIPRDNKIKPEKFTVQTSVSSRRLDN